MDTKIRELILAAYDVLKHTGCNDPDCCKAAKDEAKARERLRIAVYKADSRIEV